MSYKATRPIPKRQNDEKREKKMPIATYVEKDAIVTESIDDDYGVSHVPGMNGKWKNVSLLADTQLNADSDMLKGLVCIQVCDEGDFKALRQPIGKKKITKATTDGSNSDNKLVTSNKNTLNNPAQAPTTLNAKDLLATKAAAGGVGQNGKRKLTKAEELEQKLMRQSSGGHVNPKLLQFDSDDDDTSDIDTPITKPTKKANAVTLKKQENINVDKNGKQNVDKNGKQNANKNGKEKLKSTSKPDEEKKSLNSKLATKAKLVEAVQSAAVKSNSVTPAPISFATTKNNPDVVAFQWFDDLSDDEYTKKQKQQEKKKQLEKKLQARLTAEKLALARSLNDQFEEMNDVDEDDEFETIDAFGDDDDDDDIFHDEDDEDNELVIDDDDDIMSNPLSSLVQYDGSDNDESSDQDTIGTTLMNTDNNNNNNKKGQKTMNKTISNFEAKIAPHMFNMKQYLTTTIQDIENDEQDDLSETPYYSSQNASIFHFHQDYLSWMPYNLHPFIQLAIIREKFTSPRQIQAESLLPALRDRKDIVGIAQTGSGKTLAFLFPILQHIIEEREYRGEIDYFPHDGVNNEEDDDNGKKQDKNAVWYTRQTALRESQLHGKHFKDNLSAIVITPTRELAMQISDQVKIFGGDIALIKPTLIVGGIFLEKQIRLIQQHSPIIIGTPGRIWDVMKSFGTPVDLTFLRFLVLDEADRMVATGHFEELNNIIEHIKMALVRRQQDSDRVKAALLEQQKALQIMVQQELEKNNPSNTNVITPLDTKTNPNKRPLDDVINDILDDKNKRAKDNNSKKMIKNDGKKDSKFDEKSQPQQQRKKKPTIDFGPTFVDADSFDLDAYLDNIEKQRRGEVVPKNKNDKNKPKQADIKSKQQSMMVDSDDDVDDDDDDDEDNEFEFLDGDEEDLNDDDMDAYVDSDVDVDELINDEDDEDNNNNENNQYNDDEEVELTQSEKNRRIVDQQLVEKFSNYNNKIPTKLQVFLFSATLTLQDSAREHEAKKIKLTARELSQKQGLLKNKNNTTGDSPEEIAERQRQEALQRQREEGKSRLIELSKRLTLESPCIIDLTSQLILPPTLQQYSIELADTTSRDQALYGLLYGKEDQTAIVFVNSINMTRKIADFLRYLNVNAIALHGDTDQKGRMMVIDKFRKNCAQIQKEKETKRAQDADLGFEDRELQARGMTSSQMSKNNKNNGMSLKKYGAVLVCTDIVARGLDIPNLDLVIHYHVPFDSETYIHRCGRTARGTNFGKSIVIVSPQEDQLWRVIQHTLHVGLGKEKDNTAALIDELNNSVKGDKNAKLKAKMQLLPQDGKLSSVLSTKTKSSAPATVSDVKKITFNSKYLVHIRERLRYAHQLAEKTVEEKNNKKELDYDAKIRDALGFEDDDWELSTKEKNRRKNEDEGELAYMRNQERNSLKKAKFELNYLLKQKIWTQGGSFDW